MSGPAPFFSIIIPTYNRAQLVGKTIESVLSQRFRDFELLIVDDGSEDDTASVVGWFSDPRVCYLKKENGERGAARNYGAARAKGAYLNFFDSDDVMYPNHLEVAKRVIDEAAPGIIHLGYDFRREDGSPLSTVDTFTGNMRDQVMFDNLLSCNGVFLKKEIALAYPFVEDRVLASSEDWQLWMRLLARYPLHYSNEITSSVVQHGQRSIHTQAPDKVVSRDLFLIESLEKDSAVMGVFGRSFGRFKAERFTFFMLGFAEAGRSPEVWRWARSAIAAHPAIIFSRRFLASIKKTILS